VPRLERHVERSVAAAAAPGDHLAEWQRLLALPPGRRPVRFVLVWHSGSGPVSASAWMVTSERVQASVLRSGPPRVWQAPRPLAAQAMMGAEPLGRTLAPAQEVSAATLYARHEVAPLALHMTLEAAAPRARQEVLLALHTTP